MLAEISDKMPTIGELWLYALILGLYLGAFALMHRVFAIVMFLIAVSLAGFGVYGTVHESFFEGAFSQAVQHELGWGWIVSGLVSPILIPVMVIGAFRLSINRPFDRVRDWLEAKYG